MKFVEFEEHSRPANDAFNAIASKLRNLLVQSAIVEHIGSSAIPGAISKGDLDINVRVAQVEFAQSEHTLAANFARNKGSSLTDDFAAFKLTICRH